LGNEKANPAKGGRRKATGPAFIRSHLISAPYPLSNLEHNLREITSLG